MSNTVRGAVRPGWLRVRAPVGGRIEEVNAVLEQQHLRTVCCEARCPNLGECWIAGRATILILGSACTRACSYCSVEKRTPSPPDPGEPERVALAAAELAWRHIVVTSVTRDDLHDGGAAQFARLVEAVRLRVPVATVELLIPDLSGDPDALRIVVESRPDVLGHNIETVPRLYPIVRPQADYCRSIGLLAGARSMDPGLTLKSGLMAGVGETYGEIVAVMEDLFSVGCRSITIGQYLPPTPSHPPVDRYLTGEEFAELASEAHRIGYQRVASGPLVRSSYKAKA